MTAVVLATSKADISAAAKILKQFGKGHKSRKELGVMGKAVAQGRGSRAVATCRHWMLAGANIGMCRRRPPACVVLGAPASQLARVIKAHADKEARPNRRGVTGPSSSRRLSGSNASKASERDDTRKRKDEHGSRLDTLGGTVSGLSVHRGRVALEEIGREMGRSAAAPVAVAAGRRQPQPRRRSQDDL